VRLVHAHKVYIMTISGLVCQSAPFLRVTVPEAPKLSKQLRMAHMTSRTTQLDTEYSISLKFTLNSECSILTRHPPLPTHIKQYRQLIAANSRLRLCIWSLFEGLPLAKPVVIGSFSMCTEIKCRITSTSDNPRLYSEGDVQERR
jgi:hypothetical protein